MSDAWAAVTFKILYRSEIGGMPPTTHPWDHWSPNRVTHPLPGDITPVCVGSNRWVCNHLQVYGPLRNGCAASWLHYRKQPATLEVHLVSVGAFLHSVRQKTSVLSEHVAGLIISSCIQLLNRLFPEEGVLPETWKSRDLRISARFHYPAFYTQCFQSFFAHRMFLLGQNKCINSSSDFFFC